MVATRSRRRTIFPEHRRTEIDRFLGERSWSAAHDSFHLTTDCRIIFKDPWGESPCCAAPLTSLRDFLRNRVSCVLRVIFLSVGRARKPPHSHAPDARVTSVDFARLSVPAFLRQIVRYVRRVAARAFPNPCSRDPWPINRRILSHTGSSCPVSTCLCPNLLFVLLIYYYYYCTCTRVPKNIFVIPVGEEGVEVSSIRTLLCKGFTYTIRVFSFVLFAVPVIV